MLVLPDRNASLDLLYDEACRVKRGSPMLVSGGNCDAHISERQGAKAVLDGYGPNAESVSRFSDDLLHFLLRHGDIRGVIDRADAAATVDLANCSDEERHRSEPLIPDG